MKTSHKKAQKTQVKTRQTAYRFLACFTCLLISVNSVAGNGEMLLPESTVALLAQEISGETAKRNLEFIARQHRMRGSRGFRRRAELKGPMGAFGYDYFTDHYGAEKEAAVRLLQYRGSRGSGSDYAYEVLNLADGRRTAQEIRDAVSATYGPIPLEFVVEYLRALESIRVTETVK
jgi:hypothetical protein